MAKYMYFVFAEKQANAQRHVFCTLNENHGFARASVTYGYASPRNRFFFYGARSRPKYNLKPCSRLSLENTCLNEEFVTKRGRLRFVNLNSCLVDLQVFVLAKSLDRHTTTATLLS